MDEQLTRSEREELDRLRKENEQLKSTRKQGIYLKVSQKGAASLYGLGRFPVTLYKSQWERLLDNTDMIRSFLADNADELKSKD